MNQRIFLSQFSPQRTAPEHLESILVQRGDLLAQAVDLLRESVLTRNKHHLLFVGPRGIGKTHMVTLIHHRLAAQPDLADKLRFAWLNEDETSTSFLKLLVRIHRDVAVRYPKEFDAGILRQAIREEPATAERRLGEALVQGLDGRTLIVLIENLDGLFERLSEGEHRSWRAFIQNHPVFATVASAQRLVAEIGKADHPFYGFFDTRTLTPLDVEEARTLLRRIAELNEDRELVEFLDSARGKSRLRAIHYLAGGNPRLYILLSELVTRETLDDVVQTFEELADRQLTSFYQERLRWLSPQQQEIVQFLCLRRHPVPVKEIAENLFAGHSSITTQLKLLREMGYVVSHARGRESWYELAEPLMRVVMEVKETHDRQPLALLVDFLRVWYDRDELVDRGVALGRLGRSEEAIADFAQVFGGTDPSVVAALLKANPGICSGGIVHALFQTMSPSGTWQQRAGDFIAALGTHGELPRLGDALVRHLSELPTGAGHAAELDRWLEGWVAAGAGRRELELPLRLLRGGVGYLKTRDEGALFTLAQEERRLVREALRLPEERFER